MSPPPTGLTAGAGRSAVVLPDSLLPVDGFTSVHDPLHVRVLLLDNGTTRLCLTVIDQTSVFDDQVARTRRIVHDVCGVPPAHCLVTASHTFSAPHVRPAGRIPDGEEERNSLLAAAVDDAAARAAAEAVRSLRPARTGFGAGRCRVNVQRDVPTSHGWWLGADDRGPVDDTVGVLRVDDMDGAPLAFLVNYAVQSSVTNGSVTRAGERVITGDLAGTAMRRVEEHYEPNGNNPVALFLIGAAGDQAPLHTAVRETVAADGTIRRTDLADEAFSMLDVLGARLAEAVVHTADGITPTTAADLAVVEETLTVPGQVPPAGLHALRPRRTYAYTPDEDREVPLVAVRIGELRLACTQAELTTRTGTDIKNSAPGPAVCVVTMTNGAAKYMADEGSYDRITYPAMNSRYGRGAAEAVAAGFGELLRRL